MKRVLLSITVLLIMVTISCSEQKRTEKTDSIDITSLDSTSNPGESFYQYATGGWQEANPIPDEYARYGSFDKLREDNQVQIQAIFEIRKNHAPVL